MNARARRFAAAFIIVAATLSLFVKGARTQTEQLRRLTNTPRERVTLNPSLSGDGLRVAFESNAALSNSGFAAYLLDLDSATHTPAAFAHTRAPAPAISQDGSRLAFASTADLTGDNRDGNSEIFYLDGVT